MKLDDSISKIPKVGPVYVKRLEKIGIETVKDLLYHFPSRYLDFSKVTKIGHTTAGETVTIQASIKFIKNQYTKTGKQIQLCEVEDDTGSIKIVWFNQPYLIMTIRKNMQFSFSGEISYFGNSLCMNTPQFEPFNDELTHTGRIVPVYPETKGVSSKWIRGRIKYLITLNKNPLSEYFTKSTLEDENIWELNKSLVNIHFPNTINDALKAKERFAHDEMLYLHLKSMLRKIYWGKNHTLYKLKIDKTKLDRFIKDLPFTLTASQNKSINEILTDLQKNTPMNRLLEGDVGGGKTVVAAAAIFVNFINGYQSVVMAPTQILATQLYETLAFLFSKYKIRVKLITSAGIKGDLGSSDVYIGTHALIHRVLDSENVSLVVIDEQHRFGVEQRRHLVKKVEGSYKSPHVLTMTATPIPRTIALTLYGDLDLSILDEMPKGRIPITTWIVPSKKRVGAYSWIRDQIRRQKSQVFIVCPLIEESEAESMSQVKAATVEYENIKKTFPGIKIGLLHGKLKKEQKDQVIDLFKNKKLDVLVSTPVVEVGIDVPNATIMVIEAAERFGLAQLHQLRGRIGRGSKKSYCLLFSDTKSESVGKRLLALKESHSGFELAELDLKLRGPGEIFGTMQHGFDELKVASWTNEKLILKTKALAQRIIDNPKKHSKVIAKLRNSEILLN